METKSKKNDGDQVQQGPGNTHHSAGEGRQRTDEELAGINQNIEKAQEQKEQEEETLEELKEVAKDDLEKQPDESPSIDKNQPAIDAEKKAELEGNDADLNQSGNKPAEKKPIE